MTLSVVPITGIGEVAPGDDLAGILIEAVRPLEPVHGDVLVVTHKVVSKAEGAVVMLEDDGPDGHREIVEKEAVSILRRRGSLVIAETRHGLVCANAGVDRSNAAPGSAVLLPRDPDVSAHRLRTRLRQVLGVDLAVIITDTFGRAWRRGLIDVAIGCSGLDAILDLKGTQDWSGRELEVTEVAVADELASAADLVMGKASGIPAALIRGYTGPRGEGRATDLIRPVAEDMFR